MSSHNIINTIKYLQGEPQKRYITLTTVDTNRTLGTDRVFLQNIPNEDLISYIKNSLGPQTDRVVVYVELREVKGVSSVKKNHYSIEVTPTIQPAPVTTEATTTAVATQQPLPAVPIQNNSGLNGAFTGNGMLAVPITEYFASQKNETKVEFLTEKVEDLKQEKQDLKDKVKSEKKKTEILVDEVRDLKSKLAVAESQKEMAVAMVKLENKSWLEAINIDKILERAPDIMGKMAEMKHGVAPTGALSSPNISDAKTELFEYMADNLNDEQINYIGAICHYLNNQDFLDQLSQLLKTHRHA